MLKGPRPTCCAKRCSRQPAERRSLHVEAIKPCWSGWLWPGEWPATWSSCSAGADGCPARESRGPHRSTSRWSAPAPLITEWPPAIEVRDRRRYADAPAAIRAFQRRCGTDSAHRSTDWRGCWPARARLSSADEPRRLAGLLPASGLDRLRAQPTTPPSAARCSATPAPQHQTAPQRETIRRRLIAVSSIPMNSYRAACGRIAASYAWSARLWLAACTTAFAIALSGWPAGDRPRGCDLETE